MKKHIALILFALALFGCKDEIEKSMTQPVSVAGVAKPVSNAINANERVISSAKLIESLGTPAHSPLSLALVNDSDETKKELYDAKAQIDILEKKLDSEAKEKNKIIDRLNYVEPKYSSAVGLLWKWRLIAIGELIAVVGFFIARQYFPFLKLL